MRRKAAVILILLTSLLILHLLRLSAQGNSEAGLPRKIISKDGAQMVLIPAGDYQRGDAFGELRRGRPVETVYVDAFYIDVYEVTNAQYKKFMDATGYDAPLYWDNPRFSAPDQPVVGIRWHDAQAYCKWAGKRLPKEVEWEKAARGGLVGKRYPWGDDLTRDDANYYKTGVRDIWRYTSPVGSFAPNGYGLYDMAGNVWEWCADVHRNKRARIRREFSPLRGGSWFNLSELLCVANGFVQYPSLTSNDYGFRCAADVAQVLDR